MEFVVGLLFLVGVVIAALIVVAIQGPARYDVIIKGGAPYCPRCNRQVTYRRDRCRSCGYVYVFHGPTPEEASQERQRSVLEEKRSEERQQREAELLKQRREQRQAERERKREERNAYYLARGINPGPLAWYFVMPDWAQAITLGVAVAVIPVLVIVILAL